MSTRYNQSNRLDTSAEALRARIEQVASSITQQVASRPGGEALPAFLGDIIDAVGNVADDVVNAATDVANAVANVATDVANVANAGVQDVQNVWDLANEAITYIGGITDWATQLADATIDFAAVFAVAPELTAQNESQTKGAAGAARASAAELVRTRRAAIRDHKTTLRNRIQTQTRELRRHVRELARQTRSS